MCCYLYDVNLDGWVPSWLVNEELPLFDVYLDVWVPTWLVNVRSYLNVPFFI
jgi:hypothetical protein